MKTFILSRDMEAWKVIVSRFQMPTMTVGATTSIKLEVERTKQDMRQIKLNALAKNIVECALSLEEYNKISACETAKKIWDKLEVTHEGTSKVKRSKIRMLKHDYELFLMQPGGSIKDMYHYKKSDI